MVPADENSWTIYKLSSCFPLTVPIPNSWNFESSMLHLAWQSKLIVNLWTVCIDGPTKQFFLQPESGLSTDARLMSPYSASFPAFSLANWSNVIFRRRGSKDTSCRSVLTQRWFPMGYWREQFAFGGCFVDAFDIVSLESLMAGILCCFFIATPRRNPLKKRNLLLLFRDAKPVKSDFDLFSWNWGALRFRLASITGNTSLFAPLCSLLVFWSGVFLFVDEKVRFTARNALWRRILRVVADLKPVVSDLDLRSLGATWGRLVLWSWFLWNLGVTSSRYCRHDDMVALGQMCVIVDDRCTCT